jgi:predicted small lipoprotein YifL
MARDGAMSIRDRPARRPHFDPPRASPILARMNATIRALLCILLLALGVSACGNKGDLVLPEPPEPAPQDAAAKR